jgi:hypothetical protein
LKDDILDLIFFIFYIFCNTHTLPPKSEVV